MRDDCLGSFIKILPGFSTYWHQNSWLNGSDEGEHTVHDIFTDASWFVCDALQKRHLVSNDLLFAYIEQCVTSEIKEVSNAAVTCFLENILNRTDTSIDPDQWIPYLGPVSRNYCRGWDQWTGHRTKGLWLDSEICIFESECEHKGEPKKA